MNTFQLMKVFLTHDELSERNRTVFSYMLAERNIMLGKWFTYISGSGLFMWKNYYGHGPLNGLTKEERALLNMKEILAWNKWKTDET